MIPKRRSDIGALIAECERQGEEVRSLFSGRSAPSLLWRPDERKWSMTGHVAHLGVVNERYVDSIGSAIAGARSEGPLSDGPYRHPRLASALVRSMEPPPKRRVKTFRSMVPDAGSDAEAALTTFTRLQEDLSGHMAAARGLDLGRIRFGSPFFRLLRLSLGCAFELVLAHNRRHIWLLHEVMAREGFPEPKPGAPSA